MSELNELIASSSVHAYNSGLERGAALERDRIVNLINDLAHVFSTAVSEAEFKLPDGNDVLEVNDAYAACNSYIFATLKQIKGE